MKIPKSEKNGNLIKCIFCLALLLLGVCIGLLTTRGFRQENIEQESDSAETNVYISEADAMEINFQKRGSMILCKHDE